ncbi:NAD-dependent epimerase/dehydratase family protein [Erythrobacteraceae bacterium CFH 75059]|uniref:NAD-dependent epimerase/dehydratase family protein n=1 Tax=Qipengyuania thermophila TaxID=2509361 RepID=UPI00101F5011|nr:NAD-dependent epimerase/dehydratase family protein [Qipengyuania thermophila]TCD05260.1 NAD-dependent epimerase/dehydratase family protein [Erythrobacteraceae bacterium CFH 75059]
MTLGAGDHVLVTGGAGFVGSNLADRLATLGCTVRVFDWLKRPGVDANLRWLLARHGERIQPIIADIRDAATLSTAVQGAAAVFHFAAQVAVTTSLDSPGDDFGINLHATFGLLETIRKHNPAAALLFASTNKVYGDLLDLEMPLSDGRYAPADAALARHGISEARPLDFHTPYGCSKGAADQYVLDYARSFGLKAAVMRMSCIYGQRQCGSEDQGWVAHFLIRALRKEPITLFGDGRQVRDVCLVTDTCDAYLALHDRIGTLSGQAFNWGGGPANAVSLLEVVEEIGRLTGVPPQVEFADWRPGDQRWFVADTRRADAALGLAPRTSWREGLKQLHRWLTEEVGEGASEALPRSTAAA